MLEYFLLGAAPPIHCLTTWPKSEGIGFSIESSSLAASWRSVWVSREASRRGSLLRAGHVLLWGDHEVSCPSLPILKIWQRQTMREKINNDRHLTKTMVAAPAWKLEAILQLRQMPTSSLKMAASGLQLFNPQTILVFNLCRSDTFEQQQNQFNILYRFLPPSWGKTHLGEKVWVTWLPLATWANFRQADSIWPRRERRGQDNEKEWPRREG